MRDIYEYLSDAPHRERLNEVDGAAYGHRYEGRNPTDEEVRKRRWFAQQIENALVGVAYPITPFVPKESDVIYTSNGADDFDEEVRDERDCEID